MATETKSVPSAALTPDDSCAGAELGGGECALSALQARGPVQRRSRAVSQTLFQDSLEALKRFDAGTPPECSDRFGAGMLERFRATKHSLCEGDGSDSSSRVVCHERIPFDIPRYMCELENVMVSSRGTSATKCSATAKLSEVISKGGNTESALFGSHTEYGQLRLQPERLDCRRAVDGLALVQEPWDTANFYEWYGDWVTLYETLASLQWNPADTEVFLLGRGLAGRVRGPFQRPFDELWARAFAARGVHTGDMQELFGNGTCFRRLATVPHGGLSTLTYAGGRRGATAGCPSPTVMASALFLQGLFPSSAPASQGTAKRVTLVLRRGSRAFVEDGAAEAAVRQVLPEGWTADTFRPEGLSFAEQLDVAARTQVLVGVHGAGLTFALFLPPRARVVEVYCEDRSSVNGHYRTLEGMAEVEAPRVGGPEGHFHFSDEDDMACKLDPALVKKAIDAYDGRL